MRLGGSQCGRPAGFREQDQGYRRRHTGQRGIFANDVPVPDAVEQQRPNAEPLLDEDETEERQIEVPLEATASDWQEQREQPGADPEIEDFHRDG